MIISFGDKRIILKNDILFLNKNKIQL